MLRIGKKKITIQREDRPLVATRFSSEQALLSKLFEAYSLESIITPIHESDQVAPFHLVILAQQLRLTPLLAPRIFTVLDAL